MKVLHVYSHDNPRLAKYVSLLLQAMPADVECVFADNASDVRLAIKDFQPDIIHQHGKPIVFAASRARLVVSPHGETVDTSKAYAVIARSPYELTCHDTERKELVRNPLITKTITFDEAAAATHTVYQRVMDSHPLELMNVSTRHLLALLLKAGLLGHKEWVMEQWSARPAGTLAEPGGARTDNGQWSMADVQYRLLFIYAELEGISAIVDRGIAVLGIYAPLKPSIDCYLPHGYQTPQTLPTATIPELLKDIEPHGITLLRITELMKRLHDDSLDEAVLMEQLEADRRRPLFQSLLQILSEQTLLTEGFMPCPPLDNNLTQDLRNQLENHLRIL